MSKSSEEIDGIYLAYFTGEFGTSFGIFLIKEKTIQGGDIGSGIYDGDFTVSDGVAIGSMHFRTTGGGSTITGANTDLPVSYETKFSLVLPIENQEYHRIETLTGPINVRFDKIRSL